MRVLALLLIGLFVVLAGCLQGPSSSPTEPPITPPPGYDAENGITNTSLAVRANQDGLRDYVTFALERTVVVTIEDRGGVHQHLTAAVDVEDERAMARFTVGAIESADDTATVSERYYENGTVYIRTSVGERVHYDVSPADALDDVYLPETVAAMLVGADWGKGERLERDGEILFAYTATTPRAELPSIIPVDPDALASFDGRLVVDPGGVVRELSYDARWADDGGAQTRVRAAYNISDLGTATVTAPEWVPAARGSGSGTG